MQWEQLRRTLDFEAADLGLARDKTGAVCQ
jgi:hypothetical protein